MSPGVFQIAVIVGLVVLLFGSKHLGRLGWQLGRSVRSLRKPSETTEGARDWGQGDAIRAAQTVRKIKKLTRGGFP